MTGILTGLHQCRTTVQRLTRSRIGRPGRWDDSNRRRDRGCAASAARAWTDIAGNLPAV